MCGGHKIEGTTTFTVDLGTGVFVVRHVPALVCEQCGTDWIEDRVAEVLERIVDIAGIAMGASIVEKHFTLDRNGGGPDDSFSLEPHELKALCRDTYTAWQALGKIANEFDTKPFATYEEAESQIFDYGEDDLI